MIADTDKNGYVVNYISERTKKLFSPHSIYCTIRGNVTCVNNKIRALLQEFLGYLAVGTSRFGVPIGYKLKGRIVIHSCKEEAILGIILGIYLVVVYRFRAQRR